MNDRFLYRLRVEPSPEFATRLKARLDAQSRSTLKRVSRWGIPLLIFGVAFALSLPQVREGMARLLSGASPPAAGAQRETPPGASVLTEAVVTVGRLASLPADTRVDATLSRVSPPRVEPPGLPLGPLPQDDDVALQAGRLERMIARAAPLPTRSSNDAVPRSSTMLDEAQAAVELRRSLFKVMGHASEPLLAMAQGRRRFDLDVVATSGLRIYQLALIVPEAFTQDTRGFELRTDALDTIWTTKARFDMEARQLAVAAAFLGGSLRSGNSKMVLAGMRKVFTACESCHADYRAAR
jgi:cytochrome c556